MVSRISGMLPPVERSITVSAPMLDGHVQLAQLLVDVRGHRGVADVGVDLAQGGDADAHRLELGVVDVRGDDQASGGDLVADELGVRSFRGGRRSPSPR